MHRILRNHGDAILGTALEPIELADNSCSPSDAIAQAVKSWAPTALVKSVRFASPCSNLLDSRIFNARVYALHKGDSDVVVLEIWAGGGGPCAVSATLDRRLPAASN